MQGPRRGRSLLIRCGGGCPIALPWPIRLAGLGRYLPERVVTNAELAASSDVTAEWIAAHCGVTERRWAEPELGETNSWMAAEAIREALDEAGWRPRDLDLIVNASGTAEQLIPDGGPLIQRHLGLEDSGIPCLSVHATCLSFLHALHLAGGLLTAGAYRRVAVVASEIASPGLDGAERETRTLFGDAAAAVVIEAGGPGAIEAARFETYGSAAHLTEVRGGGSRRPPNHPDTAPSDNVFQMKGPEILQFSVDRLGGFLERLRPGLSSDLGDITTVIPHQPSRAGLTAMFERPWPAGAAVDTLDRVGNVVSACVPVNLYEARRAGRLVAGDRALLVGVGAGVSFGALIVRI